MKNDYDAEYEPKSPPPMDSGSVRWMSILMMVLVVFGFFSLAWYAYNATVTEEKQTALTVIEPAQKSYKEKPKEIGGLDIKHSDIDAYNLMRDTNAANDQDVTAVKGLAPKADAPATPVELVIKENDDKASKQSDAPKNSEIAAISKAETDMASPLLSGKKITDQSNAGDKVEVLIAEDTEKPKAITKTPLADAKQQLEKEITSTETTEIVRPIVPVIEKADTLKASAKSVTVKPAVKAKAQIKTDPRIYVQLAALRSQQEAVNMWNRLRKKHTVLADKDYYTEQVTPAGKPTLYRLRVKGFANMASAKQTCNALKSRGQDCLTPR